MSSQLPRICSHCSTVVPEGHNFCGRCGTPYQEADGPAIKTIYYGAMQAPGRAKLILVAGDAIEGMSYHLNATHHECGRQMGLIPFDDAHISQPHADFFYEEDKLYLQDLGSTNGTYVRVRGPVPLQNGAMFKAGEHFFRFELISDKEHVYPDGTVFYASARKDLRFRLIEMIDGGYQGQAYASPNHEVAVGRAGCDLNFPDDLHLSPQHFTISEKNGEFVLQDHDSMNGTFLRIESAIELVHGDYVFLGQQLLRVEVPVPLN